MSKPRYRYRADGSWQQVDNVVPLRASDGGLFGSAPFLGSGAIALARYGKAPTLVNEMTGLGGERDHARHLYFRDILMSQGELETLYRSSWAARKAIDIPVEDMWSPGKDWTGDDEGAIKAMEEAEQSLGLYEAVTSAQKAGELFGTALICILSADDDPGEPLDVDKISEGSISNLLVVDRYSCGIAAWVQDPRMPRYGKPWMYQVRTRAAEHEHPGLMHVHHSRVIRCDGVAPLLTEGWSSMERDWGVSSLNASVNEIAREEAMHGGIDQLVQEASIQVMKIDGFKDAVMGRQDRDDPSLENLAAANSAAKSLYKTLFIDSQDDTQRVQVSFAGLADLVDKKSTRLASMFDIPVTRFLGVSPGGLNSTGDSDALNYAIRLTSQRARFMRRDGLLLDRVVARHAGLAEPPDCEWRPIMRLSPALEAEANAKQAEGVLAALDKGAIMEDEARELLSRISGWYGELKPLTDAEMEEMRQVGIPPAD